ncbi:hypothetical protein C8R43DRAFT_1123739 [Mycena crocata]|nr:hypothetical protein C8R43DRAFT_1123739 [Mycena crocata]
MVSSQIDTARGYYPPSGQQVSAAPVLKIHVGGDACLDVEMLQDMMEATPPSRTIDLPSPISNLYLASHGLCKAVRIASDACAGYLISYRISLVSTLEPVLHKDQVVDAVPQNALANFVSLCGKVKSHFDTLDEAWEAAKHVTKDALRRSMEVPWGCEWILHLQVATFPDSDTSRRMATLNNITNVVVEAQSQLRRLQQIWTDLEVGVTQIESSRGVIRQEELHELYCAMELCSEIFGSYASSRKWRKTLLEPDPHSRPDLAGRWRDL